MSSSCRVDLRAGVYLTRSDPAGDQSAGQSPSQCNLGTHLPAGVLEMSTNNGLEGTLTSPTQQQANAPLAAMDAKLMVATGSVQVQQLKDMVNKLEQDSKMMVLVMAKMQAAASAVKPHSQQGNMDMHLLALASSGSCQKLHTLLDGQASAHGADESLPTRQASSYGDTEANESILAGVTAEGDTALHVVATYGDSDDFLESARIIYQKARHLLLAENDKGDTPLHCAARAGKSNMVKCLIDLARAEGGDGRVKEMLRKENKHQETTLNEAVRVGSKDTVNMLMAEDSELASFPEDGGASPMYLAIVLKRDEIVKILFDKSSHGKLSFSGPNGQNALHAAVVRYPHLYRHQDLKKLLKPEKTENKDLTTQRDKNGSTPLHFAAAMVFWNIRMFVIEFVGNGILEFVTKFRPSRICWQVFEANRDALYQPDHAGFFPIHVAASVGAFWNVHMFVTECPGSAGLRDPKGRTFLHVAVEKKKVSVVRSACRNLSLSWIMNMADNDGNTALHLAVDAGSLQMFCALLGNPQVNLNLPNNRGETPLDIAQYKISEDGFYYNESSEAQICSTLRTAGAVKGVRRQDHLLEDNKTVKVNALDERKEIEVLKESTGILCIGSVLIATVTFGATFAVPGGYIADDKTNGGSPTLAGTYAFDAFIVSNTLAFIFSVMAIIGLMYSGSPLLNSRFRKVHLATAVYFVSISLTSLAAAFALGAYVVLAPVSHKTAIDTCVLSSLILLYRKLEFIGKRLFVLPALRTRKGLIGALVYSACIIVGNMLLENWPIIFIFGWSGHPKPAFVKN